MKSLVTGVAGFIGSNVAEALIEQGHDVIGVDCFLDYYPREMKERNIAGLRKKDTFQLLEKPLGDIDLGPLVAEVDAIFHLAAQAGVRASWGKSFPYTPRTTSRQRSDCSKPRLGQELQGVRLCFVLFRLWRQCGITDERRRSSPSGLSVRSQQTGGRDALPPLFRQPLACPPSRFDTSRYMGPVNDRIWPSIDCCGRRSSKRSSRCSVTENKPVISPSSKMRFKPLWPPLRKAAMEGCTTSAAALECPCSEVIQEIENVTGAQIQSRHEPSQKGDMRDTYADTSRARKDLDYRPSVTLREGLEEEWNWLCKVSKGA